MPWIVRGGLPIRVDINRGPKGVKVVRTIEVPAGNIETVLAWVKDDPNRAQAALAAEEAAEHPRSTLLAALHRLV